MSSIKQLFLGGSSAAAYQIERSLRFNSADSAYLDRTFASAGSRTTWTWSAWIKRSGLETLQYIFTASGAATGTSSVAFNADNTLEFYTFDSSYTARLTTSQVFRDVSAWYHIVAVFDTASATTTLTGSSTDRMRLYVNGVQVSNFANTTVPSQNYQGFTNSNVQHVLNGRYNGSYVDTNGNWYMTEVQFIDGSALTAASFGETDTDTGVWKPKKYEGTYGTNGFYLKFADNSGTTSTTLGKDSSGNGNNWTPNNFSVTAGAGNDSLVDTPTPYGSDTGAGGEVRGNYCTLNPLDKGSAIALANGNLDIGSASNPNNNCRGTFGMSSGKWYFEFVITSAIGGVPAFGIGSDTASLTSNFSGALYLYLSNGTKAVNGVETAYGATFTQNDVIGVAFDADNNSITFYKNNSSQGAITGVTSGLTWRPFVHASITTTITSNFGQRPFAYTAPSGFKALCTQNLPTPTIGATATTRADDYFNTVLYTGTGATTQAVTGVGFTPDWTWIKRRSDVTQHVLTDVVRGTGQSLSSSSSAAEVTNDPLGYLTSFDSDGFTVNRGSGNLGERVNASGATFVGWNWKANGAGSTNNAGSIQSTVSASTLSGFSIVSYTGDGNSGATVGHGLGVIPDLIIIRRRSGDDWFVYHKDLTSSSYGLRLNKTDAESSNTSTVTARSSTTFTIGTDGLVNVSSNTYIAYAFAPVAGYSAFGKYTGNASTNGPFIYTGFRPAWIMIKCSSASATDWNIMDMRRDPYNTPGNILWANLSSAESANRFIDLLSNGFKIRNDGGNVNDPQTYVYAAFAEVPTKFSLAR